MPHYAHANELLLISMQLALCNEIFNKEYHVLQSFILFLNSVFIIYTTFVSYRSLLLCVRSHLWSKLYAYNIGWKMSRLGVSDFGIKNYFFFQRALGLFINILAQTFLINTKASKFISILTKRSLNLKNKFKHIYFKLKVLRHFCSFILLHFLSNFIQKDDLKRYEGRQDRKNKYWRRKKCKWNFNRIWWVHFGRDLLLLHMHMHIDKSLKLKFLPN